MQRRVLILSCNTGNGHNAAASAILEELRARGIEADMLDSLSFATPKAPVAASRIYTGIVNNAPIVFGAAYKAADMLSSKYAKSVIYLANMEYAQRLRDYIEAENITDIVCTHLFPSEAVTRIKRKWKTRVRLYNIATDYACIPFWQDTEPNMFFLPAKDLEEEFIKKGFSKNILRPTGIPVSAALQTRMEPLSARRELYLKGNGCVFLIATGSMGYGNLEPLVDSALLRPEVTNVLILGGNNARLKDGLRDRYAAESRVKVIDFTLRISLYMDAADVVFTKPGGLTTTEVAVKNKPLALTQPIPGCESINLKYFTTRGMAVADSDPMTLMNRAIALYRDETARASMLLAQRTFINPHARRDICDFIWEER